MLNRLLPAWPRSLPSTNTMPYDKLVYDLMYIENYSILEDFVIMIRTIKILVTKSATEGKDVSGKDLDLSKFER